MLCSDREVLKKPVWRAMLFRYYVDTNWQPKKMDVEVEVPLTLDLESLRSTGMQVSSVVSGGSLYSM